MTRHAQTIYHLADIVAGIDIVFANQRFVFDRNMQINLNTIRAARANAVPNFVYTGTACSFPKHLQSGYAVTRIPENLTYPANPESSYGWSKLMGEYQLVREQGEDFHVGIVRLHNVYGPRCRYGKSDGSQALPALVRKAIAFPAEDFLVWGSGRQYRDFLHVDDAVSAILAVRERGMNQGVVQVGSGEPVTLRSAAFGVAKLAKKIMNKHIVPIFDSKAYEGDRGRVAELTRAVAVLNWTAQVRFNDGLESLFRWILEDMRKIASVPASRALELPDVSRRVKAASQKCQGPFQNVDEGDGSRSRRQRTKKGLTEGVGWVETYMRQHRLGRADYLKALDCGQNSRPPVLIWTAREVYCLSSCIPWEPIMRSHRALPQPNAAHVEQKAFRRIW
jgi:GDP-D-mannose 3',5'-epimerase